MNTRDATITKYMSEDEKLKVKIHLSDLLNLLKRDPNLICMLYDIFSNNFYCHVGRHMGNHYFPYNNHKLSLYYVRTHWVVTII